LLTRMLFASLPALFSLTLFLSAGLLFLLEPMIAKMILPRLGGTPAVWNTCMMFFQTVLLAGYGYAHLSCRKAGVNRQIVIHLTLLAAACLVLPIALPGQLMPDAEGSPIGYILLLLLISVGLPFFVLSATSILLQTWFADTGHPSARDPYFLYSASNLGSMIALIGYPTLIEPYFRLADQGRAWTGGYALLLACIVCCAALTRKYLAGTEEMAIESGSTEVNAVPFTLGGRGRWVLLAFVPSSLMLGVTTFLSTDVAAIPLFWVIPLSLYLLTFIIVFARVPAFVHKLMVTLLPVCVTALIFVNYSNTGIPKWLIFIVHLINFFVFCMVCHGEIARSRPAPRHLTEFYLLISFGGVLGGVFNALIAPLTFNTVLEYPLIIVLGALLLPVMTRRRKWRKWQNGILYIAVPILLTLLTYWLTNKLPVESLKLTGLAVLLRCELNTLNLIITYGSLGLICYGLVFLKKPFLFGVGVAALLMTIVLSIDITRNVVYRERSFFGVLTVAREADDTFMNLYHGVTLHGRQEISEQQRLEPLSYYHRKGPAGQVFDAFSGPQRKLRIAVTGLGAGSLAAYGEPGQELHFYEIDRTIKMIALNPAYFTYLNDCRAEWKIILGDARLTMEKAPPHYYGIIILDAFSSDSIPVHLMTKEAVKLYFSKLSRDGILLLHISNRYLDLAPVLAELTYESGLAGRICDDEEDTAIEKYGSTWVVLARTEADLGSLADSKSWQKIERRKNVKVWTDDFSNILSVFKW
jgi:spermidine synthase